MKTNMLLDTWDETGTDIEKFKEYVSLIDSATRIVPIETNDLTLFAVIGASDTHIRLLTYDEEQTMRRIVPPASQMKISSIMDKGVTEEFLKDIMASKLLLRHEGAVYFTSSGLARDLGARAQISGNGLNFPTPERAAFLAHRYSSDPCRASFVVRSNISDGGRLHKVFALPSSTYRYIPQSTILDVMDYLETEMGTTECHHWHISPTITQLWLEFPEKALDIARTYMLHDDMMPGVLLETSDTCDCAFKVIATWRLRTRNYSRHNSFEKEHKGKFLMEDIMTAVKDHIFTAYTKLPQRLCDLLCMDVPNPVDLIDLIFERTDIVGILGKRRTKQLLPLLQSEINPKASYTAYDIALRFMELPGQFESEPSVRDDLEVFAAKVPFLDFESLITRASKPMVLIPA